MEMGFFEKIFYRIAGPFIRTWYEIKNIVAKFKWFFSKDKEVFTNSFEYNYVCVLALYQTGKIRKDIFELIKELKRRNVFTIAVNTKKLQKEAIKSIEPFVGKYIERHNYGRDFSSYKKGVLEFYKNYNDDKCKRLIILNDSIMYVNDIEGFIDKFCNSPHPAAGTTENFEFQRHLGSFTLSLSPKVFLNKHMKKYWKNYKDTDVRPTVIKRGELGFSKALSKCVNDSTEINALYNSLTFRDYLECNQEIVENFDLYTRNSLSSGGVDWKTFSVQSIAVDLRKKLFPDDVLYEEQFFQKDSSSEKKLSIIKKDDTEKNLSYVSNYESLKEWVKSKSFMVDEVDADEFIRKQICWTWFENFRSGSQIHNNFIILLQMGCPIIKLDLVYRGVAIREDVEKLEKVLDKETYRFVEEQLYSRPYGQDSLSGLDQIAFANGLL